MEYSYYNKDDPLKYSALTAGPVILTVPVVVVYLFFSRCFIAGISAGAVKG
jgi:ABC-type glycerol-3-phosphate transport system permease component